MKLTIYGENRDPNLGLFIHYAVEEQGASELVEIFRQCLPFMPRYEKGDVIKFSYADEEPENEARFVVDRVVHYIVSMAKQPEIPNAPLFQNQIYIILKREQLAGGSELPVKTLQGQFDLNLKKR